MRIAIIPSFLAPVRAGSCFGGAEVLALELAEGLAGRGERVSLVGISGSGGEGLSVVEAPPTPAFRPGDEISRDAAPFRALFAALAATHQVLHLHLNDPGALLAADELTGLVRVVSTLHLSAVFPATTEVVQGLIDRGTRITFTSPSEAARASYARSAIRVVPNGLDTRRFGPVRAPEAATLAWAGRRVPEKGIEDAWAIAALAGTTLHVAGPPPDPGAPPLGAPPTSARVVDHGRLDRDALATLLGRVEVTLVPSTIAEAYPLIAIESLLAGTPVVGYAVGGLPEIVEPSLGRLVPVGDRAAAAWAIQAVRGLDRDAIARRAQARFGLERMVDEFVGMYGGPGPRAEPRH